MKEQGWAVREMELKEIRGRRKAGSAARFARVPREWSQRGQALAGDLLLG